MQSSKHILCSTYATHAAFWLHLPVVALARRHKVSCGRAGSTSCNRSTSCALQVIASRQQGQWVRRKTLWACLWARQGCGSGCRRAPGGQGFVSLTNSVVVTRVTSHTLDPRDTSASPCVTEDSPLVSRQVNLNVRS